MMQVANDTCRTCAHWSNALPPIASGIRRPEGSNMNLGACHALAPVVLNLAGIAVSRFPETHADRTCGEWAPSMPDGGGGGEAMPDNVVPITGSAA